MTSPIDALTFHTRSGKACSHYARHGLDCDEYDALYTRANGRCEICGVPEEQAARKKLFIDHFENKEVTYVRGLVCARCNHVMCSYDGNRSWGERTTPWKEAAARYAANAWQRPRPKPKKAKPEEDRVVAVVLPADPRVLAGALLRTMSRSDLDELIAHLQQDGPRADDTAAA